MLICRECGLIFNEEDVKTIRSYVGEFWGTPAYENIWVCPDCGSECLDDYTDEEEENG